MTWHDHVNDDQEYESTRLDLDADETTRDDLDADDGYGGQWDAWQAQYDE